LEYKSKRNESDIGNRGVAIKMESPP